MAGKNYYQLLNVSRSATQAEIKKAFRKLALQFHPDKNQEPAAHAAFVEVMEAYDVLADPKKRAAYDRLNTSDPTPFSQIRFNTPADLFNAADKISSFVNTSSVYSIDHDILFFRWQILLSKESRMFDPVFSNEQVNMLVQLMRRSIDILPYNMSLQLLRSLSLLGEQDAIDELLHPIRRQIRLQHYWNRYKFAVVLLITAAVCFFIFRAANHE